MKTCKCPYCQTEANFISAKPEELPSYPAGIPSRWPNATEHLIGGALCLRKRLTRSEDRRQHMMGALAEFRCSIHEDTFLPTELRDLALEHLDTAFSPVQEEIPGRNPYALTDNKLIHIESRADPVPDPTHDWQCDACGHWCGPNLAHCPCCARPGSDLS